LKVGVKSTALRFGDSTKEWLTGFGIASLSGLALSGLNAEVGECYSALFFTRLNNCFLCHDYMIGAGWPYYAFLGVASGHLGWQIWSVDLSSSSDCNRK